MSVSVVMPYRYSDPWRDNLFSYVYARLHTLWPQFEISIGDGPNVLWNRSAAINSAVRHSHGDTLVICDADTVSNIESLAAAVRYVEENNRWAYPYQVYYNTTRDYTEQLLNQRCDGPIDRPTEWDHRLDYVVSGMIVVPREAFYTVGGFDEGYIGWGYEDDGFHLMMQRAFGDAHRVEDGFVCHLWHPAPESARFGQPFIKQNAERFSRLKRSQ